MSDANNLNEHGNHEGELTLGVGGWAEYTVHMTETTDTIRHDIVAPPDKVIPVIFLPGVMGSNLRMSSTGHRMVSHNILYNNIAQFSCHRRRQYSPKQHVSNRQWWDTTVSVTRQDRRHSCTCRYPTITVARRHYEPRQQWQSRQ